ncbi:hypothetical protein PEPS_05260 [Persicobacter psychrovividus]|uniref:Transposase n=2 Tax=Persicobacter psychrovividus TaxID=387638 RepID=A0ABM7VBI0_9BACT|nr:hypothetical protein PEPS_05260 [Persicobacter psychrovividus]
MCDYYNTIKYSREQGIEEGVEIGVEMGVEKHQIEVVKNMHDLGFGVELIAKSVKISVEAVREILKSK